VVGSSSRYDGETSLGDHAVLWPADGAAPLDLNTLIDDDGRWELLGATGISDGGTIIGFGLYYVDGAGIGFPHFAAFRLDPVPEPSLVGLLALGGTGYLWQRRNRPTRAVLT
jgi:hypothetical protein